MCCDYITKPPASRCWSASRAAVQLEKTNQQLRDVGDSLGLRVGLDIQMQPTKSLEWTQDYREGKDVFLSHSGKQKNFVRQLHRDLTKENISCFFDEDDKSLPVGDEFPPHIFKATETCKAAILVLSKDFICSKWPMIELSAFIRRARNLGKNANLNMLPIFFMISPAELSRITKDSPEWKNLKVNDDTRIEWQDALKAVRKIKGLVFQENDNEVLFRDKIVEKVCSLLHREASQNQNQNQSQRYTVAGVPKRYVPRPLKLLDFEPEGIEDQVEEVKKLLDIGSSEQALAVAIVGFAGIGKTTLAASVIRSLYLSCIDLQFSMVTIDHKAPDRRSHILQLQSDIIFHLTGEDWHFQNTQQGRQKLKEAMATKSCFLSIDNVVDSNFIKVLLPRNLLSQHPSEEKSGSEESAENPQNKKQKPKIRILITSRQNDLKPVLYIKNFVHEFQMLHDRNAEALLRRTILQDRPAHDFEESMIKELAKACRSVPLLLSTFGSHLKDNREKGSYKEAIKALNEGNIDRYNSGDEELLSEKLMYVYDQMRDEVKEAFLDICMYFCGFLWDQVADIVDSFTLETLHNKKLVNKSEKNTVVVHDILRLMGANKAKDTRLINYKEFANINDDESKLKSVKGMSLQDSKSLVLETNHLNVMRHSLRVLALGDWVRIDGPPCHRAFEKLRYLEVGDLKDFPFKDVSQMEKLNCFMNRSKPGMELAQLTPSLKRLTHEIVNRDCDEFARLPLKNLKSLKIFDLRTKRPVRLPQGFKLPKSLEYLRLNSCKQIPETFGHLSALQILSLDKCDMKCLPPGFTQSVQLKYLSLQYCTNMISLPDNIFASLSSLRDLYLRGCTRLEKLPADLGTLTALQTLDIRECETLSVLPENFGGLESLKTLGLDGCRCLQRLPESFGMLSLEDLTLKSLANLKELPQSIGDLCCLKSLRIISCGSIEFVPDSFVRLTNLVTLVVEDCIRLGALPENFDQLSSLKTISLSGCPLLERLPDGFQALKTLKVMTLRGCSKLVNLPTCFEMLSCLEKLHLEELLFSSLPDGLGKLKKLKLLVVCSCYKFQTLPRDFETLATLESLWLWNCLKLEGTTMDKIVKLRNCHYVDISWSTMLIERWNELKEEHKDLPMIVQTSRNLDGKERNRTRRVGLLRGKCMQLDSTTTDLIHLSCVSIPNNTTVAVISLQLDQRQLFQPTVDMAKERANSNCAGQLRIIYVCRRSDALAAFNEEDERENNRQALMMLPKGISYAIPSMDIRRLSLIGCSFFDDSNVINEGTACKLVCFMVDVREDDEGQQVFKDGECVTENEISKKSWEKLPTSENFDEEIENYDEIVEFINCICESKTQSRSGQCLREENMVEEFIQKLKNNSIDYFSDNRVKVEHLQGKTVAIILIDQNYPECKILQQIYQDIKLKDSNFEAIWIPLPEEEDFGFGTYSRVIQRMPWLTLANPKSINIGNIKDKNPRVIIINSEGIVGNPNALSLIMSRGADAYPFTKGSLSQLDLKSSFEFLFRSMEIEELNNKVIFLYAEPPSQKLEMKCTLEKLIQIQGKSNFEIIYVGSLFSGKNTAESSQKAYEDATESMKWTKLSFEDMMSFWYGCRILSDEMVQDPNSASTLNDLARALLSENRQLVVVDGDGMVTANGIDVVEMACEASDEEVDIMMKEELRESLREGKCKEGVRRYFCDELNHPQHRHPLRPRWREGERRYFCDGCYFPRDYTSNGKRIFRCEYCDWDLCWYCWKEFVKEEVRRQATHES